MPPIDRSLESQNRYFLRLLAAVALERGGELRIPMAIIRRLEEDPRQALFEDSNSQTDELILRFGTKHSAMYPVEPLACQPEAKPQPQTQIEPTQPSTVPPAPSGNPNRQRLPLSLDQLAAAEKKLRQVRMAAQLKIARQQESERELADILQRAKAP